MATSYTYIARIYKHTKFGANRSRIGRDMPFRVFSKMAAADILDLLFVDFGPPTMSQLLGSERLPYQYGTHYLTMYLHSYRYRCIVAFF